MYYNGSWILTYSSMWFLTLAYLNNTFYNYITLDTLAISCIGISSLIFHLPHSYNIALCKFDMFIVHTCGCYLCLSNIDNTIIVYCALTSFLASICKSPSLSLIRYDNIVTNNNWCAVLYHLFMIHIPSLFGIYMIVQSNALDKK